jgi:hypothetical protein
VLECSFTTCKLRFCAHLRLARKHNPTFYDTLLWERVRVRVRVRARANQKLPVDFSDAGDFSIHIIVTIIDI